MSSIDGDLSFDGVKLEQLIKSDTSMFDVLPSFFYHHNKLVRIAALEVSKCIINMCVCDLTSSPPPSPSSPFPSSPSPPLLLPLSSGLCEKGLYSL